MHQVRYFLALCEEANFSRAANRCGVAQPSLTRAIQQLESEFGALFIRDRAGTRLSDLGILLRSEFASIARSANQAQRKAANFRNTLPEKAHPQARKAFMHKGIYLSAIAAGILAAFLSIHSIPSVTASPIAQAPATIDLWALQATIDMKTLPAQEISELF